MNYTFWNIKLDTLPIHQGIARNMLIRIGTKSKFIRKEIRRHISELSVVGANETEQYINRMLKWAWIFKTEKLTYVY